MKITKVPKAARRRGQEKVAANVYLLDQRIESMTQTLSALIDRVAAQDIQIEDLVRWIRHLGGRTDRLQAQLPDPRFENFTRDSELGGFFPEERRRQQERQRPQRSRKKASR